MDFEQYFYKEKEFEGILLDNSGEKIYDLECVLRYNEYKPEEIILKTILFDEGGNQEMGLKADKKLRAKTLQILNKPIDGEKRYFFSVSVKRASPLEIIFSANYFYIYEDEIVDYKMRHSLFNPDELDHSKLFFAWHLHQFKEQGMIFDPIKHYKRGLIFGYDMDIDKSFEEGSWKKNAVEVLSDDGKIIFEPNMFIKEIESEDQKSYYVLPELSGRIEYNCKKFPKEWKEIKNKFEVLNEKFDPIIYALRFITGNKVYSYSHSLSFYDPEIKRYCSIKKVTRDRDRKARKNLRQMSYAGFWDLIEEFSNAFLELSDKDRLRIKRSINRFNEAFQASIFELNLTLLHSALTILLDKKEYSDKSIEIDQDLTKPDGTLPWRLANYITLNNLKWKDLLKGGEKDDFFAFNNLRNKYLKDFEHNVEDYSPLRILHRMFERVLLTELDLEYSEYEDMLGTF